MLCISNFAFLYLIGLAITLAQVHQAHSTYRICHLSQTDMAHLRAIIFTVNITAQIAAIIIVLIECRLLIVTDGLALVDIEGSHDIVHTCTSCCRLLLLSGETSSKKVGILLLRLASWLLGSATEVEKISRHLLLLLCRWLLDWNLALYLREVKSYVCLTRAT